MINDNVLYSLTNHIRAANGEYFINVVNVLLHLEGLT